MSWFPNLPSTGNAKFEPSVFEGVTLERRAVLRLSLGALGALAVGWPFRAVAEATKSSRKWRRSLVDPDLSWDSLIEQVVPMAQRLVHSPSPNEDSYLRTLRALVTRVPTVPNLPFPPDSAVASASCFEQFPVSVLQFKFAPWAVIPYHDHRQYNGVLCAIAGEVYVRSFEIAGSDKRPSANGSFLIRETRGERLSDGRTSSLSRTKNNIHHVRAGPEGARLIDFFTFFRKDAMSVYLNVSEHRRDLGPNVYEASWVGQTA
jgi:hypothetical protein